MQEIVEELPEEKSKKIWKDIVKFFNMSRYVQKPSMVVVPVDNILKLRSPHASSLDLWSR